jgi:Family of unknown function (DUF6085)
MQSVKGKCPRGCGETLFVAEGGFVTCSWKDCPQPDAAHKLLENGQKFMSFIRDDTYYFAKEQNA